MMCCCPGEGFNDGASGPRRSIEGTQAAGQDVHADDRIDVLGARVHNLKNIDVSIPRDRTGASITGLSGSGKSSLAFDTLHAEGQRRYIETFSAYARQFLGGSSGLMWTRSPAEPVIAIERRRSAATRAAPLAPSRRLRPAPAALRTPPMRSPTRRGADGALF